jgi:hypothetical protein
VDLVAVDQCVNGILIAACHCSWHPEEVQVFNHSSSDANPLNQKCINEAVFKEFFNFYPFDKAVAKPSVEFAGTVQNREFRYRMFKRLPMQTLNMLSSIPFVGSESLKKRTSKVLKLQKMFYKATKEFEFFEKGNWRFVNKKMA